jgi:hypothetical protein
VECIERAYGGVWADARAAKNAKPDTSRIAKGIVYKGVWGYGRIEKK